MLNNDFRDILSAFNAASVRYLVVGAYAVAAHGIPRATGDIDLWIEPTPVNAVRVVSALESFGAPLEGLTSSDFSIPGQVIQIGVAPRRVDILTSIDGVEFSEAELSRMVYRVDDLSVPFLSKSHLVANKRATGRPQDLADVERLLAIQP